MQTQQNNLKDGAIIMSHVDHIGNVLKQSGTYYERDMLAYIRKAVPHGGVYIDVGANIGNHSIFFSKYCGADVHSFEPVQYNYNLLHINFKNNRVAGCIYKYALSDTIKDSRIIIVPNNMGMCSVEEQSELGQPIQLRTLDTLVKEMEVQFTKPVHLIKVDVEGHEGNVLRGALGVIDQYKPELFVETATDALYNEVNALLTAIGYEAIQKFNHTPTYHFQHKSKRVHKGAST